LTEKRNHTNNILIVTFVLFKQHVLNSPRKFTGNEPVPKPNHWQAEFQCTLSLSLNTACRRKYSIERKPLI